MEADLVFWFVGGKSTEPNTLRTLFSQGQDRIQPVFCLEKNLMRQTSSSEEALDGELEKETNLKSTIVIGCLGQYLLNQLWNQLRKIILVFLNWLVLITLGMKS